MAQLREKYSTQVNSEILAAVRLLAENENRQLQTLMDEAFADLLEKHKYAQPRSRWQAERSLAAGMSAE